MFITLYIRFRRGPQAGEVIPITCQGESALIYRLDEMSNVSDVEIASIDTAGEELSKPTQERIRALLARRGGLEGNLNMDTRNGGSQDGGSGPGLEDTARMAHLLGVLYNYVKGVKAMGGEAHYRDTLEFMQRYGTKDEFDCLITEVKGFANALDNL